MSITTLSDWNGKTIKVAQSGPMSDGRLAALDYRDLLLPTALPGYLPQPLLQKLTRSAHEADFFGHSKTAVTQHLGYYTDLQSLASEDSLTFSVLAPIYMAGLESVSLFVNWLLRELEVPIQISGPSMIDFWRRLPHAQTGGRNGSEADWTVMNTSLSLLAENEFSGCQSSGLGVNSNFNQMQMLVEYAKHLGPILQPGVRNYVVLGVRLPGKPPLAEWADILLPTGARIYIRDIGWRQLVGYASHPSRAEVMKYLDWRVQHAKLRMPTLLPVLPD